MNRTNTENVNNETYVQHSRRSNLIAKILCIFAAFCLWVYVMMVESPEYEQTFSHIVVELVNAEELTSEKALAIYNGYGTMIDVTLSGKKSVISKLSDGDIVATADVSGITEGGARYDCKINVDVPAGCTLVGMSQQTVSVYLDKAGKVSVDLTEERVNTKLPDGCHTGLVEFPVDKVSVTGPEKLLSKVARAVVVLDLSGVTKTSTMTSEVHLVDKNGDRIESPYIDYYPRTVTFEVPVLKTVTVPIDVNFKYDFFNIMNSTIRVTPSEIEVTGDPSVINKGGLIDPIEIDEKIDFANLKYDLSFRLSAKDGVTLSTNEIRVIVEPDSSIRVREIIVPGENIMDTGGKVGVKYSWDKSPVTVMIMGEIDKISKITPEDITLTLDMSPYSDTNLGTIKVKAEVVIDSEYKDDIIEIGSYKVNVTFEN